MAEAIVSFVVGKLGDAFVQEVLHQYGVDEQLEKMSRELRRIQAFLKDADKKRIVDERQKLWVKEVREVAYWIEDVIDTFLSEVPEKRPGMKETFIRMFKKPKLLPPLHNLSKEINQIETRIREIHESRVTYGITNLGEGVGGEISEPVKPILLPNIDDPNIICFEANREKIVRLLLDENISRRSVVSIVGIGGLGKTTLARKAYNSEDVKKRFGLRIWVPISQKFELIDILRNIAEQLYIQSPKDLSEYQLTNLLYNSFRKERYLLVLDDIWTNELWTHIKEILPDVNNGSRTLITTRKNDIAKYADPASEPYKLPLLTEEQSLKLLLKKALPKRDANKDYPDDLYNIGKLLAEKCDGLPLALVVLGGLLSKRPANHAAWCKVMQTMDWGTEGRECTAILNTSYEDLPFALKSCFMYLAAFPEDYEVNANRLIRMWIAEGFIPQEERKTLEETAESLLEDLVQRSMIELSRRSFVGSIWRCRVHDLLRDLAIQRAKEDNFLMSCSKIDDLQSCSMTRRLAIHYLGDSRSEDAKRLSESMNFAAPSLRSLLGFKLMPNFSRHKLLKVLNYMGSIEYNKGISSEGIELALMRLKHLRYFEVGLSVGSKDKDTLKLISNMRFLQTLDLQQAKFDVDLPDCVWHVKTLRHVILPIDSKYSRGPPASIELRNVQTLIGVRSRESWETAGLPKLPNVKKLDIRPCNQSHWDTIATLLGTLELLIHLCIGGDDVPLKSIDMRSFPFYQHLQTLYIQDAYGPCGKKIAFDDVGIFPIHLTELTLENLQLREDPMPVLEKLENLKYLSLYKGCKIQQMCCSAGGFGQLEHLWLFEVDELKECNIEKSAMSMLKRLDVCGCPLLCVPLGLQHLTVLHSLRWLESEVPDTKKNEIRTICKHVPSIEIKSLGHRVSTVLSSFSF